MRKFGYLSILLLAAVLFAGTTACFAQNPSEHPRPDVDGYVWLKSTDAEKKAFLLGAGSAVAMEYHLRAKHHEEASKFIKSWTEGLKGTSWSELASKVDSYYDSNPERRDLNVFAVIWHEVIKPRIKG